MLRWYDVLDWGEDGGEGAIGVGAARCRRERESKGDEGG